MEDNESILNIYKFGSHVYGTNDENSDEDYIVVAKEYFESKDINLHVFTVNQFQNQLDNCDIQILECFFLDNKHIIKEQYNFNFILDKSKLRTAISTISSNSWVKGKKKLTVMGDYDVRLAIKSVFHSLRILDLGIQIAREGKIIDYSSSNFILEDLKRLAKEFQHGDLWQKIDEKYRSTFNSRSSEFKALAPKDMKEINQKEDLKKVLNKHGIKNDILTDEILSLFK